MKKIALLILVACSSMKAQYIFYTCDKSEIKKIKNDTLYIIPTGDKVFDDSLVLAVKKYWTICPSIAIKMNQVDKFLSTEDKYLIAPTKGGGVDYTYIASPLKESSARQVQIFFGGKHKGIRMGNNKTRLCYTPLPFYDQKNAASCLSIVIKNLNDDVDLVITKQLKSLGGYSWDALRKEINKNTKIAKTKTLLINEKSMFFLPEDVWKKYKFKYEVMDEDKIIAIINSDKKNEYCYIDYIANKNVIIVDLATFSLIYFSDPDISPLKNRFSENEMDRLNSFVSGNPGK